jgi:hypothetical protein
MANYEVNMAAIPWFYIGKAPVVFDVRTNEGGKLGTLRIRKGNVVWNPADGKYGYWLNWDAFSKVVTEKGKKRIVNY